MSGTTRSAFMDLEFPVEVWLASEKVPLERLLALQPGGVLRLTRDPDQPVDLVVNGAVVATGELVVVDSRFAFRVTTTAQQKLAGLDPATGAPAGRPAGAAARPQAPGQPVARPAAPQARGPAKPGGAGPGRQGGRS